MGIKVHQMMPQKPLSLVGCCQKLIKTNVFSTPVTLQQHAIVTSVTKCIKCQIDFAKIKLKLRSYPDVSKVHFAK